MTHAASVVSGWTATSDATACGSETIADPWGWSRIKLGVIATKNASAPTSGSNATCNTHYYDITNTRNTQKSFTMSSGITNCDGDERAEPGPGSTIICRKYDDTPPTRGDIDTSNNANDLLANDNHPYVVSVATAGGAPINLVEGRKESSADQGSWMVFSSSGLTISWDISNVDGFRLANGGRDMTFQILKICDAAGNCWDSSLDPSGPISRTHHVFSNTTPSFLTTTSVAVQSHNLANGSAVADGQPEPMSILLTDKYGNDIIPTNAAGINRRVDLNFSTDNSLYIDQYNRTGQSVFVTSPDGTSGQTFSVGNGQSKSFNNQPSSNGLYPFNFRVYSPTQSAYSKAWGNFSIGYITFDATDSIRTTTAESVAGSAIAFKFLPLYYAEFDATSDLLSGFTEGIKQDSRIDLKKNTSLVDGWSSKVRVEYGGITAEVSKFRLYGGTSVANAKVGGNEITTIEDIVSPFSFPTWGSTLYSTGFYSFLAQNPGSVGNSSNTYLSTHIAYTMDGKSVLYNSDIIGKSNYHDPNIPASYGLKTQQAGVKVLGLAYTKKSSQLTTGQIPADVNIYGSIDKFVNKTQITKNAQALVKNTPIGDQSSKSINATRLNGWAGYGKLLSTASGSTVVYFWGLNGADVTIDDGVDIGINGKRTVLAIGGNVYIKKNLYYTPNTKSLLGIIALKDAKWNGGNIYIDPGVTNVVGSLFASKSLLSYNGIELGPDTSLSILKNQLHIYGSVFTENTVGGSRKSTPECPYYISKASCTLEVAQKYDLNYLRRYYRVNNLYPYGAGKVVGGSTCNTTSPYACTAPTVTNTPRKISSSKDDPYAKYPVIIEYNSLYRSVQPPLFSLSRG